MKNVQRLASTPYLKFAELSVYRNLPFMPKEGYNYRDLFGRLVNAVVNASLVTYAEPSQ